jgi:hypothetical protein
MNWHQFLHDLAIQIIAKFFVLRKYIVATDIGVQTEVVSLLPWVGRGYVVI